MPKYEVIAESANILQVEGEVTGRNGETLYQNKSTLFYKGEILDEGEISPVVVELYDDEEKGTLTRKVLRRINEAAASSKEVVEKVKKETPKIPEPIKGYDDMSVSDILDHLDNLDKDARELETKVFKDYESANKGRKTILNYEPSEDSDS